MDEETAVPITYLPSSTWRRTSGRTMERASNQRSAVCMTRNGEPKFLVFPLPGRVRATVLKSEAQRLHNIAGVVLKQDIAMNATDPLREVGLATIRDDLTPTLQQFMYDLRPHALTRYGVPVGLLLPLPVDTDTAQVDHICQEFYR